MLQGSAYSVVKNSFLASNFADDRKLGKRKTFLDFERGELSGQLKQQTCMKQSLENNVKQSAIGDRHHRARRYGHGSARRLDRLGEAAVGR
jgi:hypothetical protein